MRLFSALQFIGVNQFILLVGDRHNREKLLFSGVKLYSFSSLGWVACCVVAGFLLRLPSNHIKCLFPCMGTESALLFAKCLVYPTSAAAMGSAIAWSNLPVFFGRTSVLLRKARLVQCMVKTRDRFGPETEVDEAGFYSEGWSIQHSLLLFSFVPTVSSTVGEFSSQVKCSTVSAIL